MYDALACEDRGIRTVFLPTEPFMNAARDHAEACGNPDCQALQVRYPLASLGDGRGRDHAVSLGLTVHGQVSASTQNQALCALVFLYRHVLGQDLGWLEDVVRAKRPQRLPVVLTRAEVKALLGALDGVHWIMASLLYGAGLRLLECLRLRVKDIDFANHQILLRDGKGHKDRRTMLPAAVQEPLTAHLEHVRHRHQHDLV